MRARDAAVKAVSPAEKKAEMTRHRITTRAATHRSTDGYSVMTEPGCSRRFKKGPHLLDGDAAAR